MQNQEALGGLRVLDLSGSIASCVAGMLLGDYGCEVVHLKPRSWRRSGELPGEVVWHRNKVCSEMDWDCTDSVAVVRRLLRGADVCITSDAATSAILELNEAAPSRLVHLHMPSGVALETGGLDVDNLIAATSGVALRQCSFGGGAIDLVTPYVSYEQGLWAVTAAIAALVEREKSGYGQRVLVDGLHGSIVANIATLVVDPTAPPIATAVGPGGPHPTYTSYRCADGRWLFLAAPTPKFQQTTFQVLGVSQIWTDPRINGDFTNVHHPANRNWVRRMLAEAFASAASKHWLDQLEAADVPAGLVGTSRDWLEEPQLQAIGQRRIMNDPVHGESVVPGTLLELEGTPAREAAPRCFVDLRQLPKWADQPQPAGARPAPSGRGPLDGIRVLNLGAMLAGPYAGMLLAELGADVVKVEPRGGDVFRRIGGHYNRGMRSLEVDLRNAAGHASFMALVGVSDVVIDNYRLGVLEHLGIAHASLAAAKPDVISVSITGFGKTGPMAFRPAFDPLIQATSGMQQAQGGDADPVFIGVAVNDVATGCAAALAACVALYYRARTGRGQSASTSLAAASTFMQSGELVQYAHRPPPRAGGRDYAGPSVLDRYYRAADGYVRVVASGIQQFFGAGFIADPTLPDSAVVEQVERAILGLSRSDAVARLQAQGAVAVAARNICELPDDPAIREGYLTTVEGDTGGAFFVPQRLARFGRTERGDTLRTAGAGEHTRELLRLAGLADGEIDEAVAGGAICEGQPLKGIAGVSYR